MKKIKKIIRLLIITSFIIVFSLGNNNIIQGNNYKFELYYTLAGEEDISIELVEENTEVSFAVINGKPGNYKMLKNIELKVRSLDGKKHNLISFNFDFIRHDFIIGTRAVTSGIDYYDGIPIDDATAWENIIGANSSIDQIPIGANYSDSMGVGEYTISSSGTQTLLNLTLALTDDEITDFETNMQFDVFRHGKDNPVFYDESEIKLSPFRVGDPNAGPDASLKELNIFGDHSGTNYGKPLTNEKVQDINIEITYQDSLKDLSIEPIFNKGSLDTSNYTKTGANHPYEKDDVITITTTDGEDSYTYNINIDVIPPSKNTEIDVTISGGIEGAGIVFNEGDNRWEVSLPFGRQDVKVDAKTKDPNAELDKSSLELKGIKNDDTFYKVGDFIVTAEDGVTDQTYPVYVKRAVGDQNVNIDVMVNSEKVALDANGKDYNKLLESTTKNINVEIKGTIYQEIRYKVFGSTDYIKYTGGLIQINNVTSGAIYRYEIEVKSQSGHIGNYELIIQVEQSKDTSLANNAVSIYEDSTKTILNNNNLTHTISNNNAKTISIEVTPHNFQEVGFEIDDFNAGTQKLNIQMHMINDGDNTYKFYIKAQDGTVKEYEVTIYKKSDEANIISLMFHDNKGNTIAELPKFTKTDNNYIFRVSHTELQKYSALLGALKLRVETSDKSIIDGFITNSNTYNLDFQGVEEVTRTISLTVVAENQNRLSYTVTIIKEEADNDNSFKEITINGSKFDKAADLNAGGEGMKNLKYSLTIFEPPANNNFNLNFAITLLDNSKAKVTIDTVAGNTKQVSFQRAVEQIVVIIITAENGEVNKLEIPIIIASDDTDIKDVVLEGIPLSDFNFQKGTENYNITIPYSFSESLKIIANPINTYSKISIDGAIRAGNYYNISLPKSTTTAITFSIFVVSEAGTEGTVYNFSITRNPARTANTLDDFKLTDKNGDIVFDLKEYIKDMQNKTPGWTLPTNPNFSIRVDDNATLWDLSFIAKILDNGSYFNNKTGLEYSGTFNVQSNSSNTLSINVVSEGGSSNIYSFSITRKNNIKEFKSVTISGDNFSTQTFTFDKFDKSNNNILDIGKIPFSTKELIIVFEMIDGSKSKILSGSSFIGNTENGTWRFGQNTGILSGDFNVESQFGEKSDNFTIRVERATAKTDNYLSELEVNVDGNNVLLYDNIKSPIFTTRVDRNINSVQIVIRVLTEDRSKVLEGNEQNVTDKYKEYTIDRTFAQNETEARITITVEAENGHKRIHTLTIFRKNADIGIKNITIYDFINKVDVFSGTYDELVEQKFDIDKDEIFIGEFSYKTNNIRITIETNDQYARVFIGNTQQVGVKGVFTLEPALDTGINQNFEITVKTDIDQIEYEKDYDDFIFELFYDRKEAGKDAFLASFEADVNGTNLLEDLFNEKTFVYGDSVHIIVDRIEDKVTLDAIGKNNATVTGNGTKGLLLGLNTYQINVTSEDGKVTNTYTLNIYRRDTDDDINNVLVSDKSIEYNDQTHTYDLGTVEWDVNELKLEVQLNNQYSTYFVDGLKDSKKLVLKDGLNTFTIYSLSDYANNHNTALKGHEFTITITRKKAMTDLRLNDLTLTDITDGKDEAIAINYQPGKYDYTIKLNDNQDVKNVRVDYELKDKQDITSLLDLENIEVTLKSDGTLDFTIEFTVTGEADSEQKYTIRLYKDILLSNDHEITNVVVSDSNTGKIFEINFDKLTTNYEIEVDYSVLKLDIDITTKDPLTKVSPKKDNVLTLTVGTNTFKFHAIAENGSKSLEYTIIITRAEASDNTLLDDLTVTDPLNNGKFLLGIDQTTLTGDLGVEFDPLTNSYVINLGMDYLGKQIAINYIKGHDGQRVEGELRKPLTLREGLNTFQITVYPEDSKAVAGIYTININVKETNNDLESVDINGKQVDLTTNPIVFSTEEEEARFDVKLESEKGHYEIYDKDGNLVLNDKMDLDLGDNKSTIKIFNEYGELVDEYEIIITRDESSDLSILDATLKDVNGNNYLNLVDDEYVYDISVPFNIEELDLLVNANLKATVTGNGNYKLNLDKVTIITFTITAENGDVETYTLNITKELNDESRLDELGLSTNNGILLNATDFNKDKFTYDFKIDDSNTFARFNYKLAYGQTVIGTILDGTVIDLDNNLALERGINTFILTIYPEDSLIAPSVYTFIIELSNSDIDLDELLVDGENILEDGKFDYDLGEVTTDKTHIDIEAILSDLNGSVTINGKDGKDFKYVLVPGINEIEIIITSEDGKTDKTYTITVEQVLEDTDTLDELIIVTNEGVILLDNNNFDPLTNEYHFTVNQDVTYINADYILASLKQTLSDNFNKNLTVNHGINTYEFIVYPEDKDLLPRIYKVIVERIHDIGTLDELLVDGENILEDGKFDYDLCEVTTDKTHLDIEAILSDLNGSITINGNPVDKVVFELKPGLNEIVIVVKSEDSKTETTYTITIDQILEDIDTLDELIIETNNGIILLDNSNFDPLTNTYNFTVNQDVTFIHASYLASGLKQTFSNNFNKDLVVNHGLNTYKFIVYPEDKDLLPREYIVTVEKIHDIGTLDELLVDGVDILEEGIFDYTLDNLTTDTESITVVPVLTDEFATYEIYLNGVLVTGNKINLSKGNNKIEVKVTSEDKSEALTYTINIEQESSDDNSIINAILFDVKTLANKLNFDEGNLNYYAEFSYTTERVRLRLEANQKAKVFINGKHKVNTQEDFELVAGETIEVKFYVEAENGEKSDEYTITIYRRRADEAVISDNTNLFDISIEVPIDIVPIDFDPTVFEYIVRIPYKYDEIYIKGHPEHKGATVDNEGAYYLEAGKNEVIYLRVIAEDGTIAEKPYKVTLIRELPNTDTKLKDLYLTDLENNPIPFDNDKFDPYNRTYYISLDEARSFSVVFIGAVKNHITQTIFNDGEVDLKGEMNGSYNTIITVTVVAESGDIGEYTIYILHDLNFDSIADIKDISIIGDDSVAYLASDFDQTIEKHEIFVPYYLENTRLIIQTLGNVVYLDEFGKEIEDNRLQYFADLNYIYYRFKIVSKNGENHSINFEIKVIREEADSNALLDTIEIDGKEILGFDPLKNNYVHVHPRSLADTVDVTGEAQSVTSEVSGNNSYLLIPGESITVSLVVKAQDGTTNTYIVEIKYVDSHALLGELVVYEIDKDNNEEEIPIEVKLIDGVFDYVVNIDRETTYVNIKGFAEDQGGARIRGFGRYRVGDADLVVPITVTSGDGTEEVTYLITISKNFGKRTESKLDFIKVGNDLVDGFANDSFDYEYKLSNNKDIELEFKTIDGNAKIHVNNEEYLGTAKISVNDLKEGNSVIIIKVVAEDGITTSYYTLNLASEVQPSLLLTILLILSLLLWIITILIIIIRRNRGKDGYDREELIF